MSAGFNALSGLETLDVITTRIRQALENTGEFKQNIAFPLMRFDFDVKVWSYPKQALSGEAGIKVGASVVDKDALTEPGKPIVSVSSGAILDTPDKERLNAGLDIPRAQPAAQGVIVDMRTDKEGSAPTTTKAEDLQAAIKAALPNKSEVKK